MDHKSVDKSEEKLDTILGGEENRDREIDIGGTIDEALDCGAAGGIWDPAANGGRGDFVCP